LSESLSTESTPPTIAARQLTAGKTKHQFVECSPNPPCRSSAAAWRAEGRRLSTPLPPPKHLKGDREGLAAAFAWPARTKTLLQDAAEPGDNASTWPPASGSQLHQLGGNPTSDAAEHGWANAMRCDVSARLRHALAPLSSSHHSVHSPLLLRAAACEAKNAQLSMLWRRLRSRIHSQLFSSGIFEQKCPVPSPPVQSIAGFKSVEVRFGKVKISCPPEAASPASHISSVVLEIPSHRPRISSTWDGIDVVLG
jgi:hypothetical protein